MRLINICVTSTALIMAAGAAADVASPLKMSSADMDRLTATTQSGSGMGTVPLGKNGPKILVLRRTKSGEAEVHEELNDFFVIRSGNATIRIGRTATGQRQVSPGEWRGGSIGSPTDFAVGPGDTLWVPAGLAHQVIVPEGGDFNYLAFKSERKREEDHRVTD